jgi:hypothetical protein
MHFFADMENVMNDVLTSGTSFDEPGVLGGRISGRDEQTVKPHFPGAAQVRRHSPPQGIHAC